MAVVPSIQSRAAFWRARERRPVANRPRQQQAERRPRLRQRIGLKLKGIIAWPSGGCKQCAGTLIAPAAHPRMGIRVGAKGILIPTQRSHHSPTRR